MVGQGLQAAVVEPRSAAGNAEPSLMPCVGGRQSPETGSSRSLGHRRPEECGQGRVGGRRGKPVGFLGRDEAGAMGQVTGWDGS